MRQAEDRVWAAITESAKRKFDYDGFKNRLSESGDERVADFILFQIIEGLAENLSHEELLLKVRGDLELFGYPVPEDEVNGFLADKKEILSAEVHAAREVLSGFAQGRSASELLTQVRKLLYSRPHEIYTRDTSG
ncbi:hypothetical protein [Pontiella sulfatireligans]|uniref:Uncharacterized protein n=1 Tax=Pontiella sulfatireligans TaxID=2750658 RepID=A0A6C2ULP2_9BACT|nr:hypothetical protein [Pontiella sulfatireligans]VGO21175.1 hypothetical protein SCARR_03246 [Pontiella sulfatireligans]